MGGREEGEWEGKGWDGMGGNAVGFVGLGGRS